MLFGDLLHRAEGLGQVAQRLVVGDDGAGAVVLLEVRVGRVDTGVDDADRDALAGQRAAVGAGDPSGWPRDRGWPGWRSPRRTRWAGCPPDVRHAGLAAQALDLRLGAAGADHADLAEGHLPGHPRWRATAFVASASEAPWTRTVVLPVSSASGLPSTATPRPARARHSRGVGAARPSATTAAAPAARDGGCVHALIDALREFPCTAAPSGRHCNPNDRFVPGLRRSGRQLAQLLDHRVRVVGRVDG